MEENIETITVTLSRNQVEMILMGLGHLTPPPGEYEETIEDIEKTLYDHATWEIE